MWMGCSGGTILGDCLVLLKKGSDRFQSNPLSKKYRVGTCFHKMVSTNGKQLHWSISKPSSHPLAAQVSLSALSRTSLRFVEWWGVHESPKPQQRSDGRQAKSLNPNPQPHLSHLHYHPHQTCPIAEALPSDMENNYYQPRIAHKT